MNSDSDSDLSEILSQQPAPHPTRDLGNESENESESELESEMVIGASADSDPALEATRQRPDCEFQEGDFIGRYEVVRELGVGGFGHVVLARDPRLKRQVAIKIPRRDRLGSHRDKFFEEGRSVARLNHPSIVNVFDIEETDDGLPFAVLEFVEGPTLHEVIRRQGLTFSQAVSYLIQIGQALAYAHGKTLIHRDLKPANVIIAEDGNRAKLMDFGMALHDLTPEENLTRFPEGTPPYMSPEQVRGENHRLDRRTDLWGVGVMMYVMLTGKRPFASSDVYQLIQDICLKDPVEPHHLNREVPLELSRICMKCLEKLMSLRYQDAAELVDDLTAFQERWDSRIGETPSLMKSGLLPLGSAELASHEARPASAEPLSAGSVSTSGTAAPVKVVPKGLRSFDGQDAEFFVDLLPGPKDRTGIPDSLRFWLARIGGQTIDPVPVGMIFGPSGCGKSSFVKAGLIPRLPDKTRTIYLEAGSQETEQRLLEKINTIAPQVVREEVQLPIVFNRLRRGQLMTGEKTLVVIDQFEQWLHSHTDFDGQLLVEALRQCDGENLMCLLLVRDDFWMSAAQFMAQLDMKVQEGVNALAIPLFDRRHARKVLTAYGRATEALDEYPTEKQREFVTSAVDEMSDQGRIIPLHLALFAQMMDSDSWNSSELRRLGGWQGLGVRFLQKMFSDKRRVRLEPVCREILRQLLPDRSATEIKGGQKSARSLGEAVKQIDEQADLPAALEMLDRDMRVITATESESENPFDLHYQLAHDFLVNPIRNWVRQKEAENWRGRAKIRLDELSGQWQHERESRFLPGPVEFMAMRWGVNHGSLGETQQKFMRKASTFYGVRATIVAVALAALLTVFQLIQNANSNELALDQINSFLVSEPAALGARLDMLDQLDEHRVKRILGELQSTEMTRPTRLNYLLANAHFARRPAEIPWQEIIDLIPEAKPDQCGNIVSALRPIANSELRAPLLERLTKAGRSDRNRVAIVGLHFGDAALAGELLQFDADPEPRETFIDDFPGWHGRLGELIDWIQPDGDPAFVSGLLKSLGRIKAESFNDTELTRLHDAARAVFQSAEHPAAHSAAEWLMNSLALKVPGGEWRAANGGWYIKTFGQHSLTFVEINPSEFPHQGELEPIDHRFYISTREVSAKLYAEFVAANQDESGMDSTTMDAWIREGDLPVSDITWFQAARFCNWLSERHKLTPIYLVNENEGILEVDPTKTGYRMPTSAEWEVANRGGTASRFFFGQQPDRLRDYAVTGVEREIGGVGTSVKARGTRMPNNWGLFDTVGNAYEWCSDGQVVHNVVSKWIRGGCASSDLRRFCSDASFPVAPNMLIADVGLRLVLQEDFQ